MGLFAFTVFTSAFLLFAVQPVVGKYILPWFGSTPGVWNTCLLFFQTALLLGYAGAHAIARARSRRAQALAYLAILAAALALLPITPSPSGKPGPDDDPSTGILLVLLASAGAPYFLLSVTGPLLQAWRARLFPDRPPWRLYALSNTGSLLALVAYPLVFERFLPLSWQTAGWSIAFGGFALAAAACAVRLWRSPAEAAAPASPAAAEDSPRPGARRIALWVALPACGSALLMAATNRICLDIAVVPFLWVLPLAIYLLTFIAAFAGERFYPRPLFVALMPAAVGAAALGLHRGVDTSIAAQVLVGSVLLLAGGMCCHGELYRLRPGPRHLTLYYLAVSAGGAVGGLLVAVVAPAVFPDFFEYHLLILACYGVVLAVLVRSALAAPAPARRLFRVGAALGLAAFCALVLGLTRGALDVSAWADPDTTAEDVARISSVLRQTLAAAAVPALAILVAVALRLRARRLPLGPRSLPAWGRGVTAAIAILGAGPLLVVAGWHAVGQRASLLASERNFYGVLKIEEWPDDRGVLRLTHGRIEHGRQYMDAARRAWPIAYYGPESGVGLAIRFHAERHTPRRQFRIGVVGLGTGTLAAYANSAVRAEDGRREYVHPVRRDPPDHIAFYEINPLVTEWAESRFFYLADARARGAEVAIHQGDARIVMERQIARGEAQAFDILVVDAFSSDSIPIHLLTDECVRLYEKHLAEGGILAVHITNRYIDLSPVLRRIAADHGREALYFVNDEDPGCSVDSTDWVLLTASRDFTEDRRVLESRSPWPLTGPRWTDDFSSLLPLIQFE